MKGHLKLERIPRRAADNEDRLHELVRTAFNSVQRVYRVVCHGRGDTDLRQKLDVAISALCRARNRALINEQGLTVHVELET